MSTLRTNALEGMDAKNSITIVAGAGNITTTNVQEGLCKCWVNFTGVTTTAARDSFNVSSLTDVSTGRTTINFSSNMNNTDFAGVMYQSGDTATAYTSFDNQYTGGLGSKTTDSVSVAAYAGSAIDAARNEVLLMGDLA